MIHEIAPHHFENQYSAAAPAAPEDAVLNFQGGKVLIHRTAFAGHALRFPRVQDFPAGQALQYLFSIDAARYYLLPEELSEEKLPEGFFYVSDREIRMEDIHPMEEMFAAFTGRHLADWYRDTRFCGRCGRKLQHSPHSRSMRCEGCGAKFYPRIMPAVIVGVTNGDRLLLTRYRSGFAYNALIAGFAEIGETIEETVQREVMEEAGLRVKNLRYYKSQPWGIAGDLLLGFYCEVDGDDTIHMDSSELKYAEWVPRAEIVLQPGSFSLTNEMMRRFKEGKE